MPLGPKGNLAHKATLLKLGHIADVLTQKQIRRSSQSGETKKHAPNNRTEEISRKRII